jgi:site-specific recombinase XerD
VAIPPPTFAAADWFVLWQETKAALLRENFAVSTLHVYHRIIRTFRDYAVAHADRHLRAHRPIEVTPALVNSFLLKVRDSNVSWSWLASNIGVIRTTFDKLAGRAVTVGVRTPKRSFRLPEILSVGEITRLIECAPTLRDRLLIGLMYGCGLRVGEVCALRWKDVDVSRRALIITSCRTAQSRQLPIPAALTETLALGVAQCAAEDHVFPGPKPGTPLSARTVERHMAGTARTAEISKMVSCTTLRHSYAVECLRSGMSIEQLRQNLGHMHIRSTMLYQRYILPGGVVSPADRLLEPVEHPQCATSLVNARPAVASAGGSSCQYPPFDVDRSTFSLVLLPFSTIPSGVQGFLTMCRTRLRDRFLALRSYINSA